MSMMYPNGQGIPAASQFMTGGQPNYGGPLVNFGRQFAQARQAAQPQQQGPQQPGAVSAPSGPNMGGKAPGQSNMKRPGDFAAKLRAFFTPGAQPQAQGGGFGPQDPATMAQNAAAGGALGGAPAGGPGFGNGVGGPNAGIGIAGQFPAQGSPWANGGAGF